MKTSFIWYEGYQQSFKWSTPSNCYYVCWCIKHVILYHAGIHHRDPALSACVIGATAWTLFLGALSLCIWCNNKYPGLYIECIHGYTMSVHAEWIAFNVHTATFDWSLASHSRNNNSHIYIQYINIAEHRPMPDIHDP